MILRIIAVFLLLIIYHLEVKAQGSLSYDHDTSYYESFPEDMNLRFYFSQKFTGFKLGFDNVDETIWYFPNTTRNMGVGFTYKWATLNLGYGFGFMNQDESKGETRYLDLQSHQYIRNWNIDLFGQFYKGYFLRNSNRPAEYLRPDIRVVEVGVAAQYVLNSEKFSFKSAFVNTEYQKKSAGTWLIGGSVFYGQVKADSSLIPAYLNANAVTGAQEQSFIKMGPLGGYAYNLVFAHHYFIAAALTLNFNLGEYHIYNEATTTSRFFYSTDAAFRAAFGYSSRLYSFGIIFVNQNVHMTNDLRDVLQTGNLRAILTYRIDPEYVPLIDRK